MANLTFIVQLKNGDLQPKNRLPKFKQRKLNGKPFSIHKQQQKNISEKKKRTKLKREQAYMIGCSKQL